MGPNESPFFGCGPFEHTSERGLIYRISVVKYADLIFPDIE